MNKIALYSLPGLFEFYDFYKVFLPFYESHKDYFYPWCRIDSIYGSPEGIIWNGGRESISDADIHDVLSLLNKYNISARLTFSNSLLEAKHLSDTKCNLVAKMFDSPNNGIIITSDILMNYLKNNYKYYYISSTTKVLTDKDELINELNRDEFKIVVPDFRFNKDFNLLNSLTEFQKSKIEFLCNESCSVHCKERKACYEAVSRINLGLENTHVCHQDKNGDGYLFSKAMENPSFIGVNDIINTYLPMGFNSFKIEGRGLGSALLLEFILYYMTKPEYQLHVREGIYLSNSLDLF